MLPAASEDILESIALYAFAESGYLNAIEKVIKRAVIIAGRDGRQQIAGQDRAGALAFVSGSDAMLRKAIAPAAGKSRRSAPPSFEPVRADDRAKTPAAIAPIQRSSIQEFVED